MINDWSETPFRLSSANVRAEFLSVPELRDYLQFQFRFPTDPARAVLDPFAIPARRCPGPALVVALIATPLGIGFSRRGILSSVAAAILLVFAMNFVTHLFSRSAKGRGFRIGPRPGRRIFSLARSAWFSSITARPTASRPGLNLFGEGRVFAR